MNQNEVEEDDTSIISCRFDNSGIISKSLKNNSPNLVKLSLCPIEGYDPVEGGSNYFKTEDDEEIDNYTGTDIDHWEEMGVLVGKHEHLKELKICTNVDDYVIEEYNMITEYNQDEYQENVKAFLKGVANNKSIQKLEVSSGDMDGDTFHLLLPFFQNNNNLVEVEIVFDKFWDESSKVFQSFLRCISASSSLVRFIHHGNDSIGQSFSHGAMVMLISALNIGKQVEHVMFSHHYNGLGIRGCKALASWLRHPTCALKSLNLRGSTITHEMPNQLAILLNGLTNNSTVTELILNGNFVGRHNTTTAWNSLPALLRNTNSKITKLNLSQCVIDSETLLGLAQSLNGNTRLIELNIYGNRWIDERGLRAFAAHLERQDCVLESLVISGDVTIVDDEMAAVFADALRNNCTLKRLSVSSCRYRHQKITTAGWRAFEPIICNTSSFNDTYQSNHTLEKLSLDERKEDDDFSHLTFYLDLNKNKDKAHVKRAKLIKVNFSQKIDMQAFIDMDLGVLPHTLSWMGRDRVEVTPLMYEFVRNLPSFYDF